MWFKSILFFITLVLASSLLLLNEKYSQEKINVLHYQEKFIEMQEINTTVQKKIREMHDMDQKYTLELSNAREEIKNLELSVRNGEHRLQLSAACGKLHQSSTSSSLDDAATIKLTDTAERNYFALRRGLIDADIQIKALQDYIKSQCIK